MAFLPKLRIVTSQPIGIVLIDDTGNYDVSANPGGWGAPNPAKTDVVRILQRQDTLDTPTSGGTALSVPDQAAYLTGGGNTIVQSNNDSVYDMHSLSGFAGAANITSLAGAMTFLMTGANSIFANAIGFTIDSLSQTIFYTIDRTQPLTGTAGSTLGALPAATNLAVTIYYDAEAYALVCQSGQACLMADIAANPCDCGCEDLNPLMTRYAQYLAMIQCFVNQDYVRADNLAKKLQSDCTQDNCPCQPIGIEAQASTGTGIIPVITVQPTAQSVLAGQNAMFSVTAIGTGPLKYQWKKNNVDIPGQISQTLLILNVPVSGAAMYSVVVYNDYGYATSVSVPLTIGAALNPVIITQQPVSASTTAGQTVTFVVTATGSPTITYQWRKNGVPIAGANSSSLVLTNVSNTDVATYDCVVSNPVNSVTTVAVTLSLGIVAMWGFSDNIPTVIGDISGLQHSGTFPHNGTITADFTDNSLPKYLIMAEPVGEQIKVRWYGDVNNNGPIGDPNTDLYGVPIIIGPWRVYYSVYKTAQTGTPLQFLTS